MTGNPAEKSEAFAAVICTNRRSMEARRAVDSVLAVQPGPSLVVIVDQSDKSLPDVFGEYEGRSDMCLIRHHGKGLSKARNIGTAVAEAAGLRFVAYMDDDCVAEPGWLAGFTSAFAVANDVALVFGTTQAAIHDRVKGTIPSYFVARKALHRGLVSKPLVEGLGACMAVRVTAWRAIVGFDDHLGAGTPLAASEENDLSLRLLHWGFAVAESPAAVVVHHGFRHKNEVPGMMAGYMRGSGAATAKMIRLGGVPAIRALALIGKRWMKGKAGVEVEHLSSRSKRLASFLGGVFCGWQKKIDRATGRFMPFDCPKAPTRHELLGCK
jgi:GT2 family glycosyltransferase